MTQITLQINKSLEENASIYFEKAKKSKKKLKGAKEALEMNKKKLEKLSKEIKQKKKIQKQKPKAAKKEWFEKFRWFISSEGFLCIGGRDATSNEILVKKHTMKNDLVFHTKIEGSPFFIIDTKGKKPGNITLEETAQAVVSYSRAWKLGIAGLEAFYVKPDQLSKQGPSGEYVPKGAFVVTGKMNIEYAKLEVAIGIKEHKIIGGPVSAVKKHAEKFVILIQGKEKTGAIAKKIQKQIGGNLDDITRFIPAGGTSIIS